MEKTVQERASDMVDSVRANLAAALESFREAMSDGEDLPLDSKFYAPIYESGRSKVFLGPEKFLAHIATPGSQDGLRLVMHVWLVKAEDGEIFACAELLSFRAMEAAWVAKLTARPHEEQDWVDVNFAGSSIKQHFDERAERFSEISKAVFSKESTSPSDRADAPEPKSNVIPFPKSQHGAN